MATVTTWSRAAVAPGVESATSRAPRPRGRHPGRGPSGRPRSPSGSGSVRRWRWRSPRRPGRSSTQPGGPRCSSATSPDSRAPTSRSSWCCSSRGFPSVERVLGQDGLLRCHRRLAPWPISLMVAHALLLTVATRRRRTPVRLHEAASCSTRSPTSSPRPSRLGIMVAIATVSIRADPTADPAGALVGAAPGHVPRARPRLRSRDRTRAVTSSATR